MQHMPQSADAVLPSIAITLGPSVAGSGTIALSPSGSSPKPTCYTAVVPRTPVTPVSIN